MKTIPLMSLAAGLWLGFAPVAPAAGKDALDLINGTWSSRYTDDKGKTTVAPCEKSGRYKVSADRQLVTIERANDAGQYQVTTTYLVLAAEEKRALMFIKGESRLTDNGDPVVWWLMFDNNDEFRWRRTDWKPEARTAARWQRCR